VPIALPGAGPRPASLAWLPGGTSALAGALTTRPCAPPNIFWPAGEFRGLGTQFGSDRVKKATAGGMKTTRVSGDARVI